VKLAINITLHEHPTVRTTHMCMDMHCVQLSYTA